MNQFAIALAGAITAVFLTGIGSAIGFKITTKAASGVLAEKPGMFGKLLILQALPSTNGIYGFLIAILILIQDGMPLGGALATGQSIDGMTYFLAALPVGIVGLVAGIAQAKAAASAIYMTGKRPELAARGIVMASMIETYPLIAVLVSVLIIFS